MTKLAMAAVCSIALAIVPGCPSSIDRLGHLWGGYKSGDVVAADHGVLFYGPDVLARPHQDVTLQARLQSPRSFRGIAGAVIRFRLGQEVLGSAVTDKEGVASIRWRAPADGDHVIEVQPVSLPTNIDEDYGRATDASYELLVCVERADQRFLVVDLDHTLVDDSAYNVLIKEAPRPMAHSREVLRKLAGDYGIIYLTARPAALTRKSKLWLTEMNYPPGVLVTCSDRQPADSSRFKAECLASLRAGYPGIVAGVGDKVGDLEAYRANQMTAYFLKPVPDDRSRRKKLAETIRQLDHTDSLQVVVDWRQVADGLGGKSFPPEAYLRELEGGR